MRISALSARDGRSARRRRAREAPLARRARCQRSLGELHQSTPPAVLHSTTLRLLCTTSCQVADCRRWARRGAPQLAGRAVEHRWRRALVELPETHLSTRVPRRRGLPGAPRRRGLPGASTTRESPIARRRGRDPHFSEYILTKRVPVTMGN
jgi:hypothetical protein